MLDHDSNKRLVLQNMSGHKSNDSKKRLGLENILCAISLSIISTFLFALFLGLSAFSKNVLSNSYIYPEYKRRPDWFTLYIAVFAAICLFIGHVIDYLLLKKNRSPLWNLVHIIVGLVAITGGVVFGNYIFKMYTEKYYLANSMQTYVDVDPKVVTSQSLMDAAKVYFTEGTRVSPELLPGAKNYVLSANGDRLCVAPITYKGLPMNRYDLWAVGLNCCSEDGGSDFTCGDAKKFGARSAMRLLSGSATKDFRTAVLKVSNANALGIPTPIDSHNGPLLFKWTDNPQSVENDWIRMAQKEYFSYLGKFAITKFSLSVIILIFVTILENSRK
eukprot:GHVL01024342.1.p1 GENE.GHVL01024342.1~~GHVL01024342.1.p1  ORF type:complete len:331 (+),score=24.75 GHVL01024342.1:64-1056(+)